MNTFLNEVFFLEDINRDTITESVTYIHLHRNRNVKVYAPNIGFSEVKVAIKHARESNVSGSDRVSFYKMKRDEAFNYTKLKDIFSSKSH